jgi:hypothetical protein
MAEKLMQVNASLSLSLSLSIFQSLFFYTHLPFSLYCYRACPLRSSLPSNRRGAWTLRPLSS